MKKAIYALSADPLTKGHIDIILRAANMFEHIIVAIGDNPNKKYTLSKKERFDITNSVFYKYSNITIHSFDGALVDFSNKMNANIIIRGLRNINDFQYEQELAAINKSLKDDLDTCFILTEPNKSHISSSSSKSIVESFFDSSEYLPLASKKTLELRINEQKIIGVTGLMGSGKSYICEQLSKLNDNVHNVDLDLLCHKVYDEENSDYKYVRTKILNEFGTLNRKKIGEIVFNDDLKLKSLNDIFRDPLKTLIREHCKNLKGLILINGATLVSENYLNFVNNNIVFVDTDIQVRIERCNKKRNIPEDILLKRDLKMKPIKEQISITRKKIASDSFGGYLVIKNNDSLKIKDENVNFNDILKLLYEI